MFYRLKQAIMCKALERRNAQNPFDAQTADNYTLEGATDPLLNNSYFFSAHNDKMSVFARLGRRVNMDESWFCIYLGGQVYSLQHEFFPSGESPLRVEREGEDWKVSFEGILNGNDEVDFQAALRPSTASLPRLARPCPTGRWWPGNTVCPPS